MATLHTVAALLAKADSTDSESEAAAYLAKAQHLATLHAIDLEVAAAAAGANTTNRMVTRHIDIGKPRQHTNVHLVELFAAIGVANDVLIDISRDNTWIIAYGTAADVDTCEAIWLAAAPHMISGVRRWIRAGKWKTAGSRPPTAREAKASWCSGFTHRIGARLADARTQAITETDTATATRQGGGAELVLVAKKDQVRSWYADKSEARGSWRGYRGRLNSSTSWSDGSQAGARAPLRRAAEIGARKQLPDTAD